MRLLRRYQIQYRVPGGWDPVGRPFIFRRNAERYIDAAPASSLQLRVLDLRTFRSVYSLGPARVRG